MVHFSCVALFALLVAMEARQPRTVRVVGTQFVDVSTGAPVLMLGPNVVVKGPPYLPTVTGKRRSLKIRSQATPCAPPSTTRSAARQGAVKPAKPSTGTTSITFLGGISSGSASTRGGLLRPEFPGSARRYSQFNRLQQHPRNARQPR